MTKCTYKNDQLGYKCNREAHPNSPNNLCILHEEMQNKDPKETIQAFYKEVEEGKTDFTGCILPSIDLTNKTIKGINFRRAEIEGDARFGEAKIKGNARFGEAKIEGNAEFVGAAIGAVAWFGEAKIEGNAEFVGAKIGYVWFDGTTIKEDAVFSPSNIGSFIIREIDFEKLEAQENAFRMAKRTQEEMGNREAADNYFYREMEARRKRYLESKEFIEKLRGFLELPLQYVFGYGVKPGRVIAWWLVTVFTLALVYAVGNAVVLAYSPLDWVYFSMLTSTIPGYKGVIFASANWIRSSIGWTGNELEKTLNLWNYLWKCIYFSITTAATPGYGGYAPRPGFETLAAFEAIFGTFMWAAFIATFARKYMRT
ncbi:MAG: pentapeptide repeat-containing protein [Candidatus Freyarchaeota archaeon]